jgi:hypothetical protein
MKFDEVIESSDQFRTMGDTGDMNLPAAIR